MRDGKPIGINDLTPDMKKALLGQLSEAEFEAVGMELFNARLASIDPLSQGAAAFALTEEGVRLAKELREGAKVTPFEKIGVTADEAKALMGRAMSGEDLSLLEASRLYAFMLPSEFGEPIERVATKEEWDAVRAAFAAAIVRGSDSQGV